MKVGFLLQDWHLQQLKHGIVVDRNAINVGGLPVYQVRLTDLSEAWPHRSV